MIRSLIAFVLLLVMNLPAFAADWKVEPAGELKADAVAEAVRGVMEPKGLRVTDPAGKLLCELWLRRDAAMNGAEVDGALFAKLQDGSLLGVIHFPADTSDYRGQGIKSGWYTLRYAVMPVNGSHQGVSPTRDFFLLCPVSEDKDPNKQITGEALMKLSTGASGSGHVSPWSLTSAPKDGLPKIETTEENHVILEVALNTKSGPLPIGITLVGKTEG